MKEKIEYLDNMTARINGGNAFCICIYCRTKYPAIMNDLTARGIVNSTGELNPEKIEESAL